MPGHIVTIEIEDDDDLYRRISPQNQQGGKINSSAFFPPRGSDNISISIAKLTSPEICLSGFEGFWLAKIKTESVRQLGLEVSYQPIEGNPAHGEIKGKFTGSTRKKLARCAEVILT